MVTEILHDYILHGILWVKLQALYMLSDKMPYH